MARPSVPLAVALLTLLVLAAVVLSADALMGTVEAAAGGVGLTWWDASLSVLEHVLILIAALLPLWLLSGRPRAEDLGLVRVSWRRASESAVAIYAAYLVGTAVLFAIVGAPPDRASATALADTDALPLLVVYAVIACVLAPPTEELFFRGFLYGSFRHRLSVVPAVVLAGGLFGLVHGPPAASMLDIGLLGIAMCVLYERTGSLLPCTAAHALHNAIAFGVVVSLSAPATVALALVAMPLATAVTWAFAIGLDHTRVRAGLAT